MTPGPEKPRVLHVITRLIVGGAQENTVDSVRALHARGWDVTLVTGPQTGPEGSLHEAATATGARVIVEPHLVREIHPVHDLLALIRLRRLIRRERFDLVHTHSSKAGIIGRWAARWARTPRIVHTVHGWGFHERQPPWLRRFYIGLERRAARITDALIVVSGLDRDTGVREGIAPEERFRTIRSAIDMERFAGGTEARDRLRTAWGIPPDGTVVGAVNRLSEQKNPLLFLEVAKRVCEARPDVWFVLVGDGPLRARIEAGLPESGRVILTGLRRDIPEVLSALDLFLLTSDWEGLPRGLLQAVA
ncbi:MAG: glycosyltransferase, partial [Verrucomicrobiota bacterium]